ncbi:MAG: hypothetical protein LQ351_008095 [Letrouitia transgressa]|nr:MAG: hypothetical protein LQ351_008095 [Letrouitia transgressa]
MPLIRKRQRQNAETSPSPPPARRRQSTPPSEVSSGNEDWDGEAAVDGETQGEGSSREQMVKKLVRLALACEYSRQPIRRADITAKVMAPHTGRQFKYIFAEANIQLRNVFGMEMVELPLKEKVTISQKRAAQRTQASTSASSNAYILTNVLPPRYRNATIIPPSRVPTSSTESAYTGLYTFILALVYLSPGSSISESKLESSLKKMNADNHVLGGEKTEKVLRRMEREGYIVKVREREAGGDETVDYVVGPRGKVEVGEKGVAGLVRKVFGKKDHEKEKLEARLVRSLGDVVLEKRDRLEEDRETEGEEVQRNSEREDGQEEAQRERRQGPRRSGRRGRRARDEGEEDEDVGNGEGDG